MDSQTTGMIVALVILVILSAFFSATETAFTSLNRIRLKSKVDNGHKKAAFTLRLADNYDRLLTTVLIGNNIVNIAASTVSALLFTSFFVTYGPVISTVFLTVVILIFGEVSPKTLAKENAEAVAMFVSPIMALLMVIFTPFNYLFSQWKKLLTKVVRSSENTGITDEELITMVSEAENEGGLDEHEGNLIRSAIEFIDLEVREILIPRVDIVGVPDTAAIDEALKIFAEMGYSRLPVYHSTIDNIVGIVHEKDCHAARYHGKETISAITGKVHYTTGSAKISELLRTLQRSKTHMAIVVDEYGGTQGLCTIEDILEELVGEIWDEHDEVIEQFSKQDDGSYIISCAADLNDLYDLFTIRGDADAATVSGWVIEELGRVPEIDDHFVYQNLDVTITRVEHHRALEIRIVVLSDEA